MDRELLDIHALEDAQRDIGSGGTAAPHLAVELRVSAHAVAADPEDDVADFDPGEISGALGRDGATTRRPCTSSVETPSHGRAAPAGLPVLTRSARIGFNASIGTNMLPGTTVSPTVDASRTISEPTPTSFMSLLISAAPLQLSAGGDVKIAVSSMYSQLPVNARFDTTHASVTSEAPA